MLFDDDKLQLAGPIAVIGAIAGAQASAHALATWPTCSLFWYLNLEVFRCFREGFDDLAGRWLGPDGLAQSLWVAIPLAALTGAGLILQRRLPLAIAGHLGLLYSALLVYDIVAPSGSAVMSGFSVNLLCRPAGLIAIPVFLASLLSSAISHRVYWRDILLGAHGSAAVASYFSGRTASAQRA
jgi:hypothetical protein